MVRRQRRTGGALRERARRARPRRDPRQQHAGDRRRRQGDAQRAHRVHAGRQSGRARLRGEPAHPGANVTGFSAFDPEIVGKWLQALKEIAPAVRQATVLYQSGYEFLEREAETVAPTLGLEIIPAKCETTAEVETALAAPAGGADRGLIVIPSPLFALNRDRIIVTAARDRLPAVYPFRFFAEAGGLMAYGIDTIDISRRAASYVARILKGEKPSNLPVQAPVKFELVINLKTAKALGLTVPPSLIARADAVIE
jgi:putative ABC transport system substrate-binding protein